VILKMDSPSLMLFSDDDMLFVFPSCCFTLSLSSL
jgi:hypothetical protein